MDHVISKQVWVDASLSDEQKILFAQHQFEAHDQLIIDYECIAHEHGRELLHAYAIPRQQLNNWIRHYQLSGKKLFVETILHGLGRSLINSKHMTEPPIHCLSIFYDHIFLSAHIQEVLMYYQKETFESEPKIVCAVRRALLRYQTNPYAKEIRQLICVNFAHDLLCTADLQSIEISQTHLSPEECQIIIPYGLALRGVL